MLLETVNFGIDPEFYSVDALDISSRGQIIPPAAAFRLKSDQRTQVSDPVATRQPFQPVGDACDSNVRHAVSNIRSRAVLTACSDGTTGLRLK